MVYTYLFELFLTILLVPGTVDLCTDSLIRRWALESDGVGSKSCLSLIVAVWYWAHYCPCKCPSSLCEMRVVVPLAVSCASEDSRR